MTKKQLKNFILSSLGYPMVKVELHDSQLDYAINITRQKFIKWAIGNATQETYFTLILSGGIDEYELPAGTQEVVEIGDLSTDSGSGGINTLFSYQNYLYNTGAMGFLNNFGQGGILDYHTTLEYLDLLDTYTADKYSWIYHKFTNILKLSPTPETGNLLSIVDNTGNTISIDSPGYVMIRCFMTDGSNLTTTPNQTFDEWLWGYDWVQEYSLAKSKEILGYTRRKFASFTSIGSEGISLDGDQLISEAKEEIRDLEERLKLEEQGEGGYILVS